MADPGMFERITAAREILGLGEEATLPEINARLKTLVKRWHPDCCGEEAEHCAEMTRRILDAADTIRAYCANYRFSFRSEEVEKYLSPAEWMEQRFGGEPFWASGGGSKADRIAKKNRHAVGRQ